MLKHRQRVRLHFKPETGMNASLEGYFKNGWGPNYVLLVPTLVEGESATVALSPRVEIPRSNVLFWEVLA